MVLLRCFFSSSGFQFYTLSKILIACRDMQLRFFKVKTLLNNVFKQVFSTIQVLLTSQFVPNLQVKSSSHSRNSQRQVTAQVIRGAMWHPPARSVSSPMTFDPSQFPPICLPGISLIYKSKFFKIPLSQLTQKQFVQITTYLFHSFFLPPSSSSSIWCIFIQLCSSC